VTRAAPRPIIAACKEVGPALFFSLLIITVSFLPVFTLEAQEGRLFSPLAYTKTFAMAGAAMLSVTLVPVLMLFFIRGRIMPEAKNPVNRVLIWLYRPIIAGVMRWKGSTIVLALLAMAATVYPASRLGSEFMPTLNEGTLFYMPTSLPGMSITKAAELLQTQNKIIKSFPEVASVIGKAGRANTATDPAPTRDVRDRDQPQARVQWRPGMTTDKLIAEIDKARCSSPASPTPGPCRSRRASTCCPPASARRSASRSSARPRGDGAPGARDRDRGEGRARHQQRLRRAHHRRLLPRHRARPRRLARYGLSVGELQDTIGTALGGEMVTTTVEGRERFGVTVRYPRELRADPQAIAREVLVPVYGAGMEANSPPGHGAAGASGEDFHRQGRAGHPHRECAALGLHLRRHPRARHRLLRRCARSRRWPRRSSSRPATTSPGAASSSTWSAPSRS
jgi:Cu(I)/Ag(I) efflux system membrane protein CusA/SilA